MGAALFHDMRSLTLEMGALGAQDIQRGERAGIARAVLAIAIRIGGAVGRVRAP